MHRSRTCAHRVKETQDAPWQVRLDLVRRKKNKTGEITIKLNKDFELLLDPVPQKNIRKWAGLIMFDGMINWGMGFKAYRSASFLHRVNIDVYVNHKLYGIYSPELGRGVPCSDCGAVCTVDPSGRER